MMCCLCGGMVTEETSFIHLLCLSPADTQVCLTCLESFESISDQHCPTCFKEGVEKSCQDCQFWSEQGVVVQHQALFHYNSAMKEFFSTYKFEGDYELRKVFGNCLKKYLKRYRGYTLVPVPLSPERFQKRGFNQVTGLLEASGKSYQELLEKREVAASSSKNRQERLETDFAFSIKAGVALPAKILLVDDIYTTGTTLNRLKKLLLDAGCQEVCTFSLAR